MDGTARAAAIAVAAGVVACSGGTAPPETGVLDAVVLDDPATRIAAIPGGGPLFAHHKQFGSKYYHGTLSADLRLLVSPDGASFVPLGTARRADVALQDGEAETALGGGAEIRAGTYRHVRLVLSEATVEVTEGSLFGSEELASAAVLEVAGGEGLALDLALPAPLDLPAGGRVGIVLDLNTELWISREAIAEGRIDPAAVAEAVSVGIRLPAGAAAIVL